MISILMKPFDDDNCQFLSYDNYKTRELKKNSSSINGTPFLPQRHDTWYDKYDIQHSFRCGEYNISLCSRFDESIFNDVINHINNVPLYNININV